MKKEPYNEMVAAVGDVGRKQHEFKKCSKRWCQRLLKNYSAIVVYNARTYDKSYRHFICEWVQYASLMYYKRGKRLQYDGSKFCWDLEPGLWFKLPLGKILYKFDPIRIS